MKLPYIASALRRNVTAASHDATACCAALQARKRDTMSLAVPQSVQKILVLTTRENTMVAHTPKARRGHTQKPAAATPPKPAIHSGVIELQSDGR